LSFEADGFTLIGPDPGIEAWARAAHGAALSEIPNDPDPLRAGGTWRVGVDLLPNNASGRVAGGPGIPAAIGIVLDMLELTPAAWHRAQVSVVSCGYPLQDGGESEAAFRFRRDRDAAHIDGLLPVGPAKQRMLREPHGFILGLALNRCDQGASPLVVWPGSHHILGPAMRAALAGQARIEDVDVTEPYKAARREVLARCERHALALAPGQAVLMHRHLLHGIAPWAKGAVAPPEGRMAAYFRPRLERAEDWIS